MIGDCSSTVMPGSESPDGAGAMKSSESRNRTANPSYTAIAALVSKRRGTCARIAGMVHEEMLLRFTRRTAWRT
jgi:hypothetical protein